MASTGGVPRIGVVTPVLDGAEWIADTVRSVVGQTAFRDGRAELVYVVADGGSTDATVELARDAGGDAVEVIVAPDRGMYDGLVNGLDVIADRSDISAYLNAGDLWHERAVDVVVEVMDQHPVDWLCGLEVICNASGAVTGVRAPYRFRRHLLRAGAYGLGVLPHVQQESTFWRTSLLAEVDLDRLREQRVAGDHLLWSTFAEHHDLWIVHAVLGAFRVHPGQQSAHIEAYRAEAAASASRLGVLDRVRARIDALAWRAPEAVHRRLRVPNVLRYDHETGRWA